MAKKELLEWWEWERCFVQVLLTKPIEIVQEASQVLEEHGFRADELKSEFHYSSIL